MPKIKIEQNVTITGVAAGLKAVVEVETDGANQKNPSVPAAKTGTMSVRTDADTGVAAVTAGHGFITGNKLDVFWSGGQRRGMTATVSSNNVTLDGGTGDALPPITTPLTVMKPVSEVLAITAADLKGLLVSSPKPGFVTFLDDADAVVFAVSITEANGGYSWYYGSGVTNPLASDVATVLFSHNDSSAAQKPVAAVVYD